MFGDLEDDFYDDGGVSAAGACDGGDGREVAKADAATPSCGEWNGGDGNAGSREVDLLDGDDDDDFSPVDSLGFARPDESLNAYGIISTRGCQVNSHWIEVSGHWKNFQCNGEGCIACRVGVQLTPQTLLPVYSLADRKIKVLPISHSQRPGSLRSAFRACLAEMDPSPAKPVVVVIRRKATLEHEVKVSASGLSLDGSAKRVISRFYDRLKARKVDLAAVMSRKSNRQFLEIPRIRLAADELGIDA